MSSYRHRYRYKGIAGPGKCSLERGAVANRPNAEPCSPTAEIFEHRYYASLLDLAMRMTERSAQRLEKHLGWYSRHRDDSIGGEMPGRRPNK